MADKNVLTVSFPGGRRIDVEHRGFTFHTDVPIHLGGDNTAPTSFNTFLASIATCTGYYVYVFLEERKLPVEGLDIKMTTHRDDEIRMIDRITFDIKLPPGVPEKYLGAIERAANFCTVKKHMMNPPEFVFNIEFTDNT